MVGVTEEVGVADSPMVGVRLVVGLLVGVFVLVLVRVGVRVSGGLDDGVAVCVGVLV